MSMLVYRCATLLVVGDHSPVVEAVVDCNSKLDPTKTTLLKVTNPNQIIKNKYVPILMILDYILQLYVEHWVLTTVRVC